MSPISFIDLVYLVFSFVAFVLVLKNLKMSFPSRRSLIILAHLLLISMIYALFLFIEWSEIDTSLEKVENILGALLPMFWAFVFYGFLQDILNHDLMLSEQKMRENEKRYKALFESANDAIFIMRNNVFVDCNAKTEEIFGCKRDVLIGNTPFNFSPELQPDGQKSAVKGNIKINEALEGRPQFFEWMHKRADGTSFDAEVSLNLIKLSTGDNLIAVVRDVTNRKLAEENLLESEYKLIEAQKIAKLGYYVFNVQDGSWTNSAELDEIFGIDENFTRDVINWLKMIHPDYRDKMNEHLSKDVLEEYKKFDKQYKIINQKTFEEKWVHGLGSLKFDADNNPLEMFGTIQDITEYKKLEEHLMQSQKMESIGKLTAGIAHDYNNIITAINGFAALALDRIDQKSNIYNFISEILDGGERAAKLTSQLLAFSRKQVIEPKILDINDAIKKTDKMLQTIVGDDLDLSIKPGESICPIKADISQLEQVLVNLVINARDAILEKGTSPRENHISIETKEQYLDESFVKTHKGSSEGNHVLISVCDTGTGISKDNLSKIFEPFFTTKEEGQGTGLGLSMVYGIVKQNDASIYITTEQGKGTQFNIYWPCIYKKKKPIKDIKIEEHVSRGSETLLVVEDDTAVADFVKSFLSSLGYTIYICSNGNDALKFVRQNRDTFDLLLTDVIMPGMNGKELADRLLEIMPNLKVIYGSGYSGEHLSKRGILYDNINFVSKPYSIHSLSKKIREVLDKKN